MKIQIEAVKPDYERLKALSLKVESKKTSCNGYTDLVLSGKHANILKLMTEWDYEIEDLDLYIIK